MMLAPSRIGRRGLETAADAGQAFRGAQSSKQSLNFAADRLKLDAEFCLKAVADLGNVGLGSNIAGPITHGCLCAGKAGRVFNIRSMPAGSSSNQQPESNEDVIAR
jgi:hypothetical protein